MQATGTFEVNLSPITADPARTTAQLGSTMIDKQFRGDLEATSRGQMLSAMGSEKGSAGYVAMERVTGRIDGREGSFVLQHAGTMTRGAPQLSVTVVPDSGTDGLLGLSGSMAIDIVDGEHRYRFDYALPEL